MRQSFISMMASYALEYFHLTLGIFNAGEKLYRCCPFA